MRKLRAWLKRLAGTFKRFGPTAEFDEELATHIALDTERGIRAGLAPGEARRQALIRLGGAEQIRIAHRERRGLPWLESLLRDLRYSARSLARHPAVTAVAILSIGLGIGANTTIFSMVSRFVLRPAPVSDPSTLLAIQTVQEGEQCCNSFPLPLVSDLRQQAKSFSGVAAYYELIPASISGGAEPERVWGQGVTPNFFRVTGIPMMMGSGFVFHGANPIGQHVNGGRWTYEIIGVVGTAKSRTVGEDPHPILYRSLDQTVADDPSLMGYTLVVHTQGDPAALAQAVRRQVYAIDPAMAIYNEETMQEHVRTAFVLPRFAAMLFGVFGGIGLLLATVGLYGVMSFAVGRRTREIGVRMAMGARPGAVMRLVMRQGMTLAVIGVVLGWPASWLLARLASSFLYGIAPHDAVTFAAVPTILAAVALLACWLPARRAASINPNEALRAE